MPYLIVLASLATAWFAILIFFSRNILQLSIFCSVFAGFPATRGQNCGPVAINNALNCRQPEVECICLLLGGTSLLGGGGDGSQWASSFSSSFVLPLTLATWTLRDAISGSLVVSFGGWADGSLGALTLSSSNLTTITFSFGATWGSWVISS